jgi:hypothetical protein
MDHDPFDMLADVLAVRDVIAGQSFLLMGSPRLPNCLAYKGLDIGRRYGLQEGLRYIIPIPNALLVAWLGLIGLPQSSKIKPVRMAAEPPG